MESKKWATFANYNDTITIKYYLGNAHGVHASMFPVNYEDLKDIPDDIIFRVTRSYLDSAYIRINEKKDELKANGESLTEVLKEIYEGILFKDRKTLCHTNLATAKSVLKYLKYVDTKSTIKEVIPGIVSYDKFLEHVKSKTKTDITNDIELTIYNKIVSLDKIDYSILNDIANLKDNNSFKRNALLLLKAMSYKIEDMHYQNTKKHNKDELILLREKYK